jgi:two-component system CheB/CheR fusion protein
MVATGSTTLPDYIRYLQRNPDEYPRLVNSFLIKVTEFFRDPEIFEYLRDKVIPAVVEEARQQGELRIWSAGCATGEEAYSLAILVAEALGDRLDGITVRIFATDLDADAIAFARRGVYPARSLSALPQEVIERYFTRVDSTYEVRKVIRSMVVLGQHDLAQRAPFPRIDIIFCRNVLIYFTAELQKRALQVFAFSLRDSGFLVLGKAETVSPLPEYFALEQARLKVYRRIGERVLMPSSRIRDTMVEIPSRVTPARSLPVDKRATRSNREPQAATAGERAESILMRMPTGVIVVDQRYDIQTINAAARRLCGIHGEAVGKDLLHLVQYIPLLQLRNAIDGAFRGETTTMSVPVAADQTVTGESLDLQIHSAPDQADGTSGTIESVTLMIYDTSAIMNELRLAQAETSQLRESLEKTTVQAQRLAEANRALVYANEELTSSNAELRNVNEELLVANEEVQSATEEVETLNEELQATNEELETLNEELQATVEELNTTNDDLQARSVELQDLAISLEVQRRESEAERDRVQVILDNLTDGVLVVNERGEPVLSNETFQAMFGASGESFRPEDAMGRPLTEDLRLQDRVAAGEAFTSEFLLTGPDGNRNWYEAMGQPVEDASGERLGIIIIRNITDRSLRALQDEFLALASHELRTPLTSLSGSLQMLQRRLADSGDERMIRQLDVARIQTRQLTALIRDLVDVVRLQTGRLVLDTVQTDLRTIIRDAADASEPITQGKPIELDLPDEPLVASVDPNRLSQVLMNLINNAVTHAPETDKVEIRLRAAGNQAEIRVCDNGPGVPEEERERIFARFSQLGQGSSQRNHRDGLGLGLYIAREIVVAHGGTITVESDDQPGAIFVVSLPV